MRGKIIVIEGTDCSGKETQSKRLKEYLINEGFKCESFSFPMYDTPTGKIVGGPYLGKDYITDCWFPEKAPNVDYKVASLYYAADRAYNMSKINELLDNGVNVILDRYTYSNMGHQAGKVDDKYERLKIFSWIEKLEFEVLGLPRADIKIFLHMPTEEGKKLRNKRSTSESLDEHEKDDKYLKKVENTFMEMASLYSFKTIECVNNGQIRSIDDISEELESYVISRIENKKYSLK